MALFGRDEKDAKDPAKERIQPQPAAFEPRPIQPPPPAPSPLPRKDPVMLEKEKVDPTETTDVSAYLGKGSKVSGKLNFDGTVRVNGSVEGEITAQDTLIVGESAVVTAQINGNTIIITGKVTGDINAKKRVEIRAPGKLYGNIVTPNLVIHEGVHFEGHCSMGSPDSRGAEMKPAPFPKEEKGAETLLAKTQTEAPK